jgi:hypothetical protein
MLSKLTILGGKEGMAFFREKKVIDVDLSLITKAKMLATMRLGILEKSRCMLSCELESNPKKAGTGL